MGERLLIIGTDGNTREIADAEDITLKIPVVSHAQAMFAAFRAAGLSIGKLRTSYGQCRICQKTTRGIECYTCTQRNPVEWINDDGIHVFTLTYEVGGFWRAQAYMGLERCLYGEKFLTQSEAAAAIEPLMTELGFRKLNPEADALKAKLRKLPREQRWWG